MILELEGLSGTQLANITAFLVSEENILRPPQNTLVFPGSGKELFISRLISIKQEEDLKTDIRLFIHEETFVFMKGGDLKKDIFISGEYVLKLLHSIGRFLKQD
jgi:hypothetical protein